MWDLGRSVDIQLPIRGAPLGHNSARLHGSRNEALANDALLDHDFRFRERFINVTTVLVVRKSDVVGPLGMDRRSALRKSPFRFSYGRNDIIINFNQVGGVVR